MWCLNQSIKSQHQRKTKQKHPTCTCRLHLGLPRSAARMAAAASRQFACAEARDRVQKGQGQPANQARPRQERRDEAPNWSQLSLPAPARRSMFNYPWPKTREKARLHASGRVPLSGAQPSLPDPSQASACVFLSHLHPAANLNPPHNPPPPPLPPPHHTHRQSRAEDITTPQPWRSCR